MPQQCSYTREELAEAVRTSETIAETLRKVGLVPRGGNYATLRRKLAEWDIDGSHLERIIKEKRVPTMTCTDGQFRATVASSETIAEVIRRLGVVPRNVVNKVRASVPVRD